MCFLDLHERSAEEGNDDHWQPAWHLRETPHDVRKRNVDTSLLQQTVKRVENSLIGRGVLVVFLCVQLCDFQRCDTGSVERDISSRGSRLGLVWQRSWNEEVVDRWRTNCPHAAQNLFNVAINLAQMRWVWCNPEESDGRLYSVSVSCHFKLLLVIHTFHAFVALPQSP